MKIVINIWILRKKELDGIGTFIKETISRIIEGHPEVTFLLLCDRNFTEDYFDHPNVEKYRVFPALRHPLLYIFYMETVVPMFLNKHKPDLFLAPEGICSLLSCCKQLACVHDLNFIHQPENLDLKNRLYYRNFLTRHIKKATRIATVSQYTKNDIVNTFRVNENRIDIVYSGLKASFSTVSKKNQVQTKDKITQGKPYFFFVGSLHPRKNIIRLMEAFDLFKKETRSDYKLVLSGNFMWDNSKIKDKYEHLTCKDDIVFTGRVSEGTLTDLYAAAACITFVPTFEGFGLPIVEAFAAEIPLICSNVTSMPEIAGDAAILVDPYNIEDIKDGMLRIFKNKDDIVARLVERGKGRSKLYTWDNTAELLWESIMKCIS